MQKKINIVLAEDHTILREGLKALLSAHPKFKIIGEAEDGREAVRCVEKMNPDLILMDLSMPRMSGMEAIREIKRRYPGTKIIALTVHKTEEYLHTTLQAGADGYVLKDATHDELVLAIKNVMKGKSYLRSFTFCQSSSASSFVPAPVTAEIGCTGAASSSWSCFKAVPSGSRSVLLAIMTSGFCVRMWLCLSNSPRMVL